MLVVRPAFTTFTEAGTLAQVGLNAAGLAVTPPCGGTVASILMDPVSGTLLAGSGPPCCTVLERCKVPI